MDVVEMTYQRYCEDLKRFNQPITLTEYEFNIKYAKPVEPEKTIETRRKEPTLKLSVSAPKATIKKPPKPIIVKSPRVRDRSNEKPRNRTGRVMTPKTDLSKMTDEEKKAHKAKLSRIWKAKQKELGKYKKLVMTEEVREKKREYYRKNRDRIREQSNKSRAKILATEEGREAARLRTKLWREQNPEKVREINEKRKQKKWEKRQQSQNVTST